MNKTQLVEALAARIGDRKTAAAAVDGLLDTIVDTVKGGDSVSITGFGVFEPRARAARVARNPRTGETVDVAAATVPAFRPGAGFRTAVGGSTPAPRATRTRRRAAAPAPDPAPVAATRSRKPAQVAAEPVVPAPKAAKVKAAPKAKKVKAPEVDAAPKVKAPKVKAATSKATKAAGAGSAAVEKPKRSKAKK